MHYRYVDLARVFRLLPERRDNGRALGKTPLIELNDPAQKRNFRWDSCSESAQVHVKENARTYRDFDEVKQVRDLVSYLCLLLVSFCLV